MEITSFKQDYLPEMAQLFTENYRKLRTKIPSLPDAMENADPVTGMLADLAEICPGVVALDGGKVVGYMGWYLVDHFRGTDRKGAFCPEWAHAAAEEDKPAIYRAMYRDAAGIWQENGCELHGLALLAHDHAAREVWFWNGFGLTVVDAIRSIQPLENMPPVDFTVRMATLEDLELLCALELEHGDHYRQPPILMQAYHPVDAAAMAAFLAEPHNTIWIAEDDSHQAMGYLRFDAHNTDCAAVVIAPDRISCTGAYIRPQYRGRRAAPVLLNAALCHYAAQGFTRCSVDFESFNPEAAGFWTRYFEPVCLSMLRVPELQPA